MTYNPYDLLAVKVNGHDIMARPIEFDTQIENHETLKNSVDGLVKPTKLVTVCPDCGQGLDINVHLPDPPFPVVELNCHLCKPAPPPIQDPFINPLDKGKIDESDLDPMISNVAMTAEEMAMFEQNEELTVCDTQEDDDLNDLLGIIDEDFDFD